MSQDKSIDLNETEHDDLANLAGISMIDIKKLRPVNPNEREAVEGHVYILLATAPSLPQSPDNSHPAAPKVANAQGNLNTPQFLEEARNISH